MTAAPWCGRPLPDDRDGWKARAMAFKETAEEAEQERDKAQALAASLSEDWHRIQAENVRLRAALTEIEHYSNSLMGWAAPYGDSVFLKVTRPGQLARKALAE